MTVYFIGAGPGDPDLLTIKARDLIASCPLCLYAGSILPDAVVAHAPETTRVISSAPMALEEIIDLLEEADAKGQDVARVHSGDPSIYSAVGEQIAALEERGTTKVIRPFRPDSSVLLAATSS